MCEYIKSNFVLLGPDGDASCLCGMYIDGMIVVIVLQPMLMIAYGHYKSIFSQR